MPSGRGAAQRDLGPQHDTLRHPDFPLHLHQSAHASRHFGKKRENLPGHGTAGDPGSAHRSQLQIGQRRVGGITLRHHPAQLGKGLDQDDTGHQGISREVTSQKGFIAAHQIPPFAALAGNQGKQFVHKAERGAVGQAGKGIGGQHPPGYAPARLLPRALAWTASRPFRNQPLSCATVPAPSSTHLLLIPTYNTGPKVLETVREALAVWAPVWVVADGSDDGTTAQLEALAATEPHLRVIRHPRNCGKGAAVFTGALLARDAGFTHLLSFDADGQHPAAQIGQYMGLSHAHPQAMIFGKPVFPGNAPAERVMGRKLANFWVDFHTGWWGIGDSMFGMRLFPVGDLVAVMEATWFGRRYDFECEAGIRLCWRGVPVINVDTPVRYLTKAEGGVSHYHYLRDNVRLVTLFLRHFPGSLARWPWLLAKSLTGRSEIKP